MASVMPSVYQSGHRKSWTPILEMRMLPSVMSDSPNLNRFRWSSLPDFERKPVESTRTAFPSGDAPIPSADLAHEKHYTVIEVAKLWSLSQKTVRKIFESEPGVIQWGSEERRHKRPYRTLRIPETVLRRVHRKLRKAS